MDNETNPVTEPSKNPGGTPPIDPGATPGENNNSDDNKNSNNSDDIKNLIAEMITSQIADLKETLNNSVNEFKENSSKLEAEKQEFEVQKLLEKSNILDGRFYDFINSKDLEVAETKVKNLEKLVQDKINEEVENQVNARLNANTWIPGQDSNLKGNSYKKPSYIISK